MEDKIIIGLHFYNRTTNDMVCYDCEDDEPFTAQEVVNIIIDKIRAGYDLVDTECL